MFRLRYFGSCLNETADALEKSNRVIARWGNEIAEGVKSLDIQRWLKSLNTESKLAWTTIAKMRGDMSRIYKVGALHERVTKNPVLHVETRCKSTYRAIVITPAQTFNILKSLTNIFHHTLVVACAATALRSSEILALSWAASAQRNSAKYRKNQTSSLNSWASFRFSPGF